MTTINIRIDEKLKKNATEVLSSIGVDLSSAIKMFLNQVVVKREIPFNPRAMDEFGEYGWETSIDFRSIDKDGVDVKKILKAFQNGR